MKSFTDIEQSKQLAETLPLESADMSYRLYREEGGIPDYHLELCPYVFASWIGVPAWSLSALLDVYPMIVGRDMDMYCCWQNSKNLHSRHYDNPVDACYEMILKLKEKNLL